MNLSKKILFFGYGANKSKSKISYIIGHDPGEYVGAILEGYILAIQKLGEIPEKPQNLLRELFGNEFQAYTIRKGKGVVVGMIWELTQDDLVKIKEWEFDGIWREFIEVEVKASGGKLVKVVTEKVFDHMKVSQVADGLLYSEFDFVKKEQTKSLEQDQYYTSQQLTKIRAWLAQQAK